MKYIKNQRERHNNRERRRFLDMVARAGVSTAMLKAVPLLAGVFASRYATAQAAANKRVVFMYLPNGAPPGLWRPSSATQMNLCTEPYLPVASVCEFHSVNMGQGGHGSTFKSMGTYEYSSKDTLDAHLSRNFPTAPYRVVRAGVQAAGYEFFTKEAGQQAAHIEGSAKLYQNLFSGTPPTNSTDDSYKRVFAMSRGALSSLQRKLGVDEYQRFDSHLDSLAAIERRIENANTPQDVGEECKTPATFTGDPKHIVDDGKTVSDIVIAALKCGLTNVATIQLSNDQAGWFAGGRLPGLNDNLNHHNFSHSGNDNNTGKMVALLSQVPAYFIQQLVNTEGPDGQPLINTTLFVQVTDMGDGNHGLANAPFLLASRMSGFSGFKAASGSHKSFMGSISDRIGLAGTLEA